MTVNCAPSAGGAGLVLRIQGSYERRGPFKSASLRQLANSATR